MSRPNKLADADTTWMENVLLDAEDFTAAVTLNVPMDDTAGTAEYEELIDFDEPSTPAYMHEAARAFTEATVRFIRERAAAQLPPGREMRCTSCTSACCARIFSEVNVTPEDAALMGEALVKRGVVLYPHGTTWKGDVGMLRRIPWAGEGEATWEGDERKHACVFLDVKTSLCTIYEVRPRTCRTFSAHDCEHFEEGSTQLVRLRRKEMAKHTSTAAVPTASTPAASTPKGST